jgi:hypothetical protein
VRWWEARTNAELAAAAWPAGGAVTAVLMETRPVARLACCDGQSLHLLRLPQAGRAEVEATTPLPVAASRVLWDGARLIVGGGSGIAEFDPQANRWTRLCATGPGSPFAFAATEEGIYFTSGPNLYRVARGT